MIDGLQIDAQLAGAQVGHVEQVADHAIHELDIALDALVLFAHLLRRELVLRVQQHRGRGAHHRQRRAQVMRHDGEHVFARTQGACQLLLLAIQLDEQLAFCARICGFTGLNRTSTDRGFEAAKRRQRIVGVGRVMKTMGVALVRSAPRMTSARRDPSRVGICTSSSTNAKSCSRERSMAWLAVVAVKTSRSPDSQCRLERGQGHLVLIDDQAFHPLGSFSHRALHHELPAILPKCRGIAGGACGVAIWFIGSSLRSA